MTTNNQQAMTDETIREEVLAEIATAIVESKDGYYLKERAMPHVNAILSLLSQHSASQEAEIKRLNSLLALKIGELGVVIEDLEDLKADSQKRIEEVILYLEKKSYPEDGDGIEFFLTDEEWESLKKQVRGDGT